MYLERIWYLPVERLHGGPLLLVLIVFVAVVVVERGQVKVGRYVMLLVAVVVVVCGHGPVPSRLPVELLARLE